MGTAAQAAGNDQTISLGGATVSVTPNGDVTVYGARFLQIQNVGPANITITGPNATVVANGNTSGAIPVSYKPITPDELAAWARDAARKQHDVSPDGYTWLGVSTSTQELLLLEPRYQKLSNWYNAKKLEGQIGPFQRRLLDKEELNQVYQAKQAINAAIQSLPANIVQPLNKDWHWSASTHWDNNYACIQRFGDGEQGVGNKSYNVKHVRLVRSLPPRSGR